MNGLLRLVRLFDVQRDMLSGWNAEFARSRVEAMERADTASATAPVGEVEGAVERLSAVLSCLEGARKRVTSESAVGDRGDAKELPKIALEAVTTSVPDAVVVALGGAVRTAFGMRDADAAELGRLWLADVKRTAWDLLVEHELDSLEDSLRQL